MQISANGLNLPATARSVTVPAFAARELESYQKNGQLDGLDRQPLSRDESSQLLRKHVPAAVSSWQMMDESAQDQARQDPGHVILDNNGRHFDVAVEVKNLMFEGSALVTTAHGLIASFDDDAYFNQVTLRDNGSAEVVHLDKHKSENSFQQSRAAR